MQRRPCPLALDAARKVLGKLVDTHVDLDVEVALAMEAYARQPLAAIQTVTDVSQIDVERAK